MKNIFTAVSIALVVLGNLLAAGFCYASVVIIAPPPIHPQPPWQVNTNTPNSMNIVGYVSVNGQLPQDGSLLAAYDPDGVLCGVAEIHPDGGFNLAVYGDDETSSGDEGAVAGNSLNFALFNSSSGEIFSQSDLLFKSSSVGHVPHQFPPLWENMALYAMDVSWADTDKDGISDAAELAAGTSPDNADTDNDGIDDQTDPDPLQVNANIAAFSMLHTTVADGRQLAQIAFDFKGAESGLGDLTATIKGPNNFIYSVADTDVRDGSVVKSFPSLEEGIYTLTVTDSFGNSVNRADSYAGKQATPLVDLKAVSYLLDEYGNYLFQWPKVNADQTYFYCLKIFDAFGKPVYRSSPSTITKAWVSAADYLPDNGANAYKYLIETSDRDSFGLIFNRSQTAVVDFTANQGNVPGLLDNPLLYNHFDVDGRRNIVASVGVPADIAEVSLAEVTGPHGFSYRFDLNADFDRNGNLLTHTFSSTDQAAPQSTGVYTFHALINGVDYYASATLTPAVQYPAPDSRSWQVERTNSSFYKFSWADVNYNGLLYYRVTIFNENNESYITPVLHKNSANLHLGTLRYQLGEGPLSWWVDVLDGDEYTALRNRRNGPLLPLQFPTSVTGDTGFSARFAQRTLPAGQQARRHWATLYGLDADQVLALEVDGPEQYRRNLKSEGDWYEGYLYKGFGLTENEAAPPGLYTYRLTTAAQTLTYFDTLTEALPLSQVDFRSVHIDQPIIGDQVLSWAPVYYESPLWYNVIFKTLADHNGDGAPDEILSYWNLDQPVLEIPAGSLPEESVIISIQARDAKSGALENNRSHSVHFGYEGAGFDYGRLVDADQDGWASNVDPDDHDPFVYPFAKESSQALIGVSLTGDKPSPQQAGTHLTFTASPDGGNNIEYLFRLRKEGESRWSNVQEYSAADQWVWDTADAAPGSYQVVVWAREAGSTAQYEKYSVLSFTLEPGALSSVALSADLPSPQNPGATITFRATSLGGNDLEYLFRLRKQGDQQWINLQGYSTQSTWSWDTGSSYSGTYQVVVWVREAGSSATYQEYAVLSYSIIPVPLRSVTLTTDLASPQKLGSQITFNASPAGGSYLEYSYRLKREGTLRWTDVRGYSASPSWIWDTANARDGNYKVVVWAREIGSGTDYQQYSVLNFTLEAEPLVSLSLVAEQSSPQHAGSTLKFTATAVGGRHVEYFFSLSPRDFINGPKPQGYSEINTWKWANARPGNYTLLVWARSSGSSERYQKSAELDFRVDYPPLPPVSLSEDKISPQPRGSTITFVATPQSDVIEYQFRVRKDGLRDWTIGQAYSTNNRWSWSTAALSAGTYKVVVWARKLGSTNDFQQYAVRTYRLTETLEKDVSLQGDKPSPQPVGSKVNFTATPQSDGIEYEFRVRKDGDREWTIGQPHSINNHWTWATGGLSAGKYTVVVWARAVGSTDDFHQYDVRTYRLTETLEKDVSLQGDKPSPQPVGSSIRFTATPQSEGIEYEFRVRKDGDREWTIGQPHSTNNLWTWATAGLSAGDYTVVVWARAVGSTDDFHQYAVRTYRLTETLEKDVSLQGDTYNPQPVGSSISFTATPQNDGIEYEFRVRKVGDRDWTIGQPYSINNHWTWATGGLSAGDYTVVVWARAVGSTDDFHQYDVRTCRLTETLETDVSLQGEKPSPQLIGSAIDFTASPQSDGVEYEFRLRKEGDRDWTIVQPYSSQNEWTWFTSGLTPEEFSSAYKIVVWARAVGSTDDFHQYDVVTYYMK